MFQQASLDYVMRKNYFRQKDAWQTELQSLMGSSDPLTLARKSDQVPVAFSECMPLVSNFGCIEGINAHPFHLPK